MFCCNPISINLHLQHFRFRYFRSMHSIIISPSHFQLIIFFRVINFSNVCLFVNWRLSVIFWFDVFGFVDWLCLCFRFFCAFLNAVFTRLTSSRHFVLLSRWLCFLQIRLINIWLLLLHCISCSLSSYTLIRLHVILWLLFFLDKVFLYCSSSWNLRSTFRGNFCLLEFFAHELLHVFFVFHRVLLSSILEHFVCNIIFINNRVHLCLLVRIPSLKNQRIFTR